MWNELRKLQMESQKWRLWNAMITVRQWWALILANYDGAAMISEKLQMQPNPHCTTDWFFDFQMICDILTILIDITEVMTNLQYQISNPATKQLLEYHTCLFTLMRCNGDELQHCLTLHASEGFVFASVDLSCASIYQHLRRWLDEVQVQRSGWGRITSQAIQASEVKVEMLKWGTIRNLSRPLYTTQ